MFKLEFSEIMYWSTTFCTCHCEEGFDDEVISLNARKDCLAQNGDEDGEYTAIGTRNDRRLVQANPDQDKFSEIMINNE
jgi:hypothetical protein